MCLGNQKKDSANIPLNYASDFDKIQGSVTNDIKKK